MGLFENYVEVDRRGDLNPSESGDMTRISPFFVNIRIGLHSIFEPPLEWRSNFILPFLFESSLIKQFVLI
jgi:hypothetical protein